MFKMVSSCAWIAKKIWKIWLKEIPQNIPAPNKKYKHGIKTSQKDSQKKTATKDSQKIDVGVFNGDKKTI